MAQIQSLQERKGFKDFALELGEFESKEHFLYMTEKSGTAPTDTAKEEVVPILQNGLPAEIQEELLRARLKNARLTFKENWQRWTETADLWEALSVRHDQEAGLEQQKVKVQKQLKRSADKCLYYSALIQVLCGTLGDEKAQGVY